MNYFRMLTRLTQELGNFSLGNGCYALKAQLICSENRLCHRDDGNCAIVTIRQYILVESPTIAINMYFS